MIVTIANTRDDSHSQDQLQEVVEIVGVFFVGTLLLSLMGVAVMTACTITTVRKSFLEEQAEILKSNADDLEEQAEILKSNRAALEREQNRLEYVMNQAQQAGQ